MKAIHGYTGTAEHTAWLNMMRRCQNDNHPKYYRYGARGIRVCKEWSLPKGEGFKNFLSSVGKRPNSDYSLDRIDNDGDYTPNNVRWVDRVSQQRNRGVQSNNTSGHRGVSWDKAKHRWDAYIYVNKKMLRLGYFTSLGEAVKKRTQAEKLYWENA